MSKIYYYSLLVISLIFSCSYAAILDLESMAQDIVLQTKQIKVPGFQHAFNPSIVRWQGHILMSFRFIPNVHNPFTSYAYLVRLDHNFQPIEKPQLLDLRKNNTAPSRIEDGRLICANDRLFFVYSDNTDLRLSKGGFRMHIAELEYNTQHFEAKFIERITMFEGNDSYKREKNWAPFLHQNQLLLAYSLQPHRIIRPIMGSSYGETYVASFSAITWPWGELRGGTPALLLGDHYLAFFHSSKKMKTKQSGNKEIIHYFIGAYTFSAEPPFAITQMSRQPIVAKKFYDGKQYKPYWKPVNVVFPCGFITDEQYIWIAYGRADHELWIAQLDKKKLYASLASVNYYQERDEI